MSVTQSVNYIQPEKVGTSDSQTGAALSSTASRSKGNNINAN
jgi:hypothetical protein